jgi:hypothetical protein
MKSFLVNVVVMGSQKPYIAMLFIQFVYAGMALFSKAAIAKGMNPYVFVVYRQAFASLALAPFAFFLERLLQTLSTLSSVSPLSPPTCMYTYIYIYTYLTDFSLLVNFASNVQSGYCSLIIQLTLQNLLHLTLWVCTDQLF